MKSEKILVVDDEARMRKLLNDFLTFGGYNVVEAANGLEALEVFEKDKDIALILLDVMMPHLDGYGVCNKIRAKGSNVPIIMLTAKSTEKDELKGYEYGIDEYITKPFSPKILVARVGAVLRRSGNNEVDILEHGKLKLDKISRTVTVDGENIQLSYKEFELLEFFMQHKGEALSRDKILNGVWNYDYFGDARTIDTHVKKLRTKLGSCESYIQTCWGVGYKFENNE